MLGRSAKNNSCKVTQNRYIFTNLINHINMSDNLKTTLKKQDLNDLEHHINTLLQSVRDLRVESSKTITPKEYMDITRVVNNTHKEVMDLNRQHVSLRNQLADDQNL
jgi:predicted metal-binding transcription factor (methanogenesis marker protein 9)